MPVIHPVCCGMDGHVAQLTACVRRVREAGQITTEVVEYGATYRELVAFGTWWQEQHGPVVALERTGVDWKPVSHVVSAMVEVHVANGRDGRQRPGKKTDTSDATWIAELVAHGLITPRCVPPPAMRAWRDLTRTRVALVQTRTPATNRVSKMLEDPVHCIGSEGKCA